MPVDKNGDENHNYECNTNCHEKHKRLILMICRKKITIMLPESEYICQRCGLSFKSGINLGTLSI